MYGMRDRHSSISAGNVWRLLALGALSVVLACVGVMILAGSGGAQAVLAQAETPRLSDSSCRGCHGDNERTHTLPSGETLSLMVPLAHLDQSVHSRTAQTPITCTSCHTGARNYRYPHEPHPAQTLADYRQSLSAICTDCHYPHNPFHEIQDPAEATGSDPIWAGEGMPLCADCHGNHNVAPTENIHAVMPTACVACHTDQSEAWAADILMPRLGWGQAAEGYVGSQRCMGCHADRYLTWRDTLHATTIQRVADAPAALVADFGVAPAELPFDSEQVDFVIGGKWQQRFITQAQSGDLWVLPARWNVATQEWVMDPLPAAPAPEEGAEPEVVAPALVNWLAECSYCHVTGLNMAPLPEEHAPDLALTGGWGFQEFGIGCEDCHGPGAAHAADPTQAKPFSQADDQVCGACHSRGESPEGHPFPATFRPGDTLADHFTFTTSQPTRWPDGSARVHNQQYPDWMLGNTMQRSGEVQCSTCHAVHSQGEGPAQLTQATNQLCTSCHVEKVALARHIPYHQKAMQKQDFACNDCHMPLMATSALDFDIHSHTFLQPNPQNTLDHGGLETMPNACNQCHTDISETAEWAATTISWALDRYVIRSVSPFGPGPTPAPLPVPTALPSAGDAYEVSAYVDFAWLRTSFFVVLGLLGVVALGLLARYFWLRRQAHVG